MTQPPDLKPTEEELALLLMLADNPEGCSAFFSILAQAEQTADQQYQIAATAQVLGNTHSAHAAR